MPLKHCIAHNYHTAFHAPRSLSSYKLSQPFTLIEYSSLSLSPHSSLSLTPSTSSHSLTQPLAALTPLSLSPHPASSRDQAAHMMSLRENVAVGLKPVGFNFHYDVSIPIKDMYNLVEKVGTKLLYKFTNCKCYLHGSTVLLVQL